MSLYIANDDPPAIRPAFRAGPARRLPAEPARPFRAGHGRRFQTERAWPFSARPPALAPYADPFAPVTLPPLERWLPARIRATAGAPAPEPDRRREAVDAAKAFIEEHLGDPLDVGRISRAANLSRPHFTRVFRELEGATPWAYVMERRVRRAAELLERGAPPSRVAFDTGFVDQSHLTRVFKRLTGRTPGEHRRDGTNVQDRRDAAA